MKNTKKCKSGNTHGASNERLEKGGDEGLSTFSVCFSYNLWENPDSPWAPGENPRWLPSKEFGKTPGKERLWWAGLPDGKVVTAAAELHGLWAQRTSSGNCLSSALWTFLQKWRWGHLVNHRWGGTAGWSCKPSTQPTLMRTRHPEAIAELAGREWEVGFACLKPPPAKQARGQRETTSPGLSGQKAELETQIQNRLWGACARFVPGWLPGPFPEIARGTCEKYALAPFRPRPWGHEGGNQRSNICSKSSSPLPGISSLAHRLSLRNGEKTAPSSETWRVLPWTTWDPLRPGPLGMAHAGEFSAENLSWVQPEGLTF